MRFLLYNIRYGAGSGLQIHFPLPFIGYLKRTNGNLKNISDFIKSKNPDFVGLIEVDSGSFRSEKSNQAEAIAKEMRHEHVYQSKYSNRSLIQKLPVLNKQGNAFLSNRKIRRKAFHYFTAGVKRLVMELELDDFVVFLVHLSLKFRHRHNQLKDLYGFISSAQKPVMVAGDFNVFQGDKELELFLAATGLKNANGEGYPSHPSWFPRRQLDYILHSPEIHIKGYHLPHVEFSDHIPLVMDFEIEKAYRRKVA